MFSCCRETRPEDIRVVWFNDFLKTLPSMQGKRVAITGTTSGTGLAAARACAGKGAEVVLLNRPSERAEEAERSIKEEYPDARVRSIPCDLSDLASVRAVKGEFAKAFGGGFAAGAPQLDVLCCNAGVMAFPDKATKDGFDIQMQTNHLSHFLLVKALLPSLEAAAQAKGDARVVNHSSGARHGRPLDAKYFEKRGGNLGGDERGACFERYHHSKLANIAFTYALDARLRARASKVKAVCATPGIAATALVSNLETGGTDLGAMSYFFSIFGPYIAQSAADGAMPILLGMAGPEVESGDLITPSGGIGGRVEIWGPAMVSKRPLPNPEKSWVCEEERALRVVWEESEKALGERFDV